MRKFILLAFLLGTWITLAYSCSCFIGNAFVVDYVEGEIIIKAKVIDHKTLPVDQIRKELSSQQLRDYSVEVPTSPLVPFEIFGLMKLLIEDKVVGSVVRDTIIFANGHSSMCMASISELEVGTDLILKLKMEHKREFMNLGSTKFLGSEYRNLDIYTTTICSNWRLELNNNYAIGYIFKNKRFKKLRRAYEVEDLKTRK